MVRELVPDGAHDLIAQQFGGVPEVAAQGVSEDDDAIVGVVAAGLTALVEPVGPPAASAVGDHDGDVLEGVAQQVGEVVEGVADELFEVLVVERVELEELHFVGIDRQAFARELLRAQHDLIELGLGLGVAPAGQAHRDEGGGADDGRDEDRPDGDVLQRAHGADAAEPLPDDDDDQAEREGDQGREAGAAQLTGGALS